MQIIAWINVRAIVVMIVWYSPFDFYKSSEKNSYKSSFQVHNLFSRCILIYDIYELWQLIKKNGTVCYLYSLLPDFYTSDKYN